MRVNSFTIICIVTQRKNRVRRAFCHVHERNIDEDLNGEATQLVFRQRRACTVYHESVYIVTTYRRRVRERESVKYDNRP